MPIRQATLKDAQTIATIHVRSWQAAYRGQVDDLYLDRLDIDARTRRWERTLSDDNYQTLVYEDDNGQIVGFTTCEPHEEADLGDDVAELMMIYLLPEAQGQGLGRVLCEATIEMVREQGFNRLILWTLTSNKHAHGFYEHLGFVADGKTDKYPIGGMEYDIMRYILTL